MAGDRTVTKLIEDIGDEISGLYKVAVGIGMLDMVGILPLQSPVGNFMEPSISDNYRPRSAHLPNFARHTITVRLILTR